ncbi:type I methionyl aminopeptidase [Halanaerobacter jeridensis]|uniref:Methionine aminopeptidase n=1 Tax=Halanaerobacter jeridensis TaxID=706427 RepID=A0A938XRF8_9FIRM|nr:type I methionyl aminopeptidase [Halanaerobacter jeridensis]MBM7556379.1 methionyl aminopeptidase [Halanaerobacter jeridensis]
MIIRKSSKEIKKMKEAGQIVAETHQLLADNIEPGVTTQELDKLAEDYIRGQGAEPIFKGYHGFPASICASVNEVIVHGIPDDYQLQEGDIISIDIGARINGFCGDAARTWGVGEISQEASDLLTVTNESLAAAIKEAKIGNRLSDISHAVQSYVEAKGYGVVRNYSGHGIGRKMHEAPQIPNYGKPDRGPRLREGMVLAIEPMINIGTHKNKTLDDGWTVVTKDKKMSAHFENTVAITEDGPEILTVLD